MRTSNSKWALIALGALGVTPFGGLPAFAQEIEPGSSSALAPQVSAEGEAPVNPFFANYYGIFYGPSIESPKAFQVSPEGKLDKTKPILVKNYLTAGYSFNE